MEMKVQTEQLAGSSGLHATRTQETAGAGTIEKHPESRTLGGGEDSVQLSGLAARISEAVSGHEIGHSDRVAAIAASYARGRYETDAVSLSRALVTHALRTGQDGGRV
jgi:hypothetical protein